MAEVTVVLKRLNERGKIVFEAPVEPEIVATLKNILRTCQTKYNDYVSVTFKPPYKPRSTGYKSQNHHLNGHIMQICKATGNSYKIVKDCIKQIAMEQFGYGFETIAGHMIPKSEADCDTSECAMLIEAAHYLAADLGIVLKE